MDLEELERLAVLVQQANIRELTLRQGEARITIRKSTPTEEYAVLQAPGPAVEDSVAHEITSGFEDGEAEAAESVAFITSPLVGVFRHVNPVVCIGASVKEGQTVGVIESMNLVHEVEASDHGIVTDVLIEDGVAVEYGQRLFALQTRAND